MVVACLFFAHIKLLYVVVCHYRLPRTLHHMSSVGVGTGMEKSRNMACSCFLAAGTPLFLPLSILHMLNGAKIWTGEYSPKHKESSSPNCTPGLTCTYWPGHMRPF